MNFSVLYFATVGSKYGGVEQKVISQYDAMLKVGFPIRMFLVMSEAPARTFADEIEKRSQIKVLVNNPHKVRNPMARRREKFSMIAKVLVDFDPSTTALYFRYPDSDYAFLQFLKAHRQYKIVTEHQEFEGSFTLPSFWRNVVRYYAEQMFGTRIRRLVTGFVGVTSEITAFQLKRSRVPGKKSVTIGNGIDVTRFPVRKINTKNPDVIKILFVGSGYRHHGLDRLINGMQVYLTSSHKKYDISLRVAGHSEGMGTVKDLAEKLNMDRKIEFLGHLDIAQLNAHYDWADVGCGSLGVHRLHLKYTSTLKAREYFSRGLPFVISTIDEDLVPCSKYVLQVDGNNSSINMKSIVKFALAVRSDRNHPVVMREFSLINLDWTNKMRKLKSFLTDVVQN